MLPEVKGGGGGGGLQLDSAMNNFWSLNLADQNNADGFKWRELTGPPTRPRAFNITTHQNSPWPTLPASANQVDQDCVYVLGGRCQVDDAPFSFSATFGNSTLTYRLGDSAPTCRGQ